MSEVQRRQSTMSTERRYAIAISVALILGGVYWALTSLTEQARSSQDRYPVEGDSLVVHSSSADVEVRAGDVREITVDRTVERNIFGSDPNDSYRNGRLEIRNGHCGLFAFGCDTKYVVTVPKDLKLTLEGTSGDLTVADLPGGATVRTTSGSIEAHRIGGDLTVQSTSGDVDARDLTASKVKVNATSGSVDLRFSAAPTTVEAETSSGDVTVEVPDGTETYRVLTDTSSGDESTEVRTDPDATRTITATTSSGDAVVEYAH